MKKIIGVVVLMFTLSVTTGVFASDNTKEIIKLFRAFQIRYETGVNFSSYNEKLADLRIAFADYNGKQDVKNSLDTAIYHYQKASAAWSHSLHETGNRCCTRDFFYETWVKEYPDIATLINKYGRGGCDYVFFSDVISLIRGRAEKEVNEAESLYNSYKKDRVK